MCGPCIDDPRHSCSGPCIDDPPHSCCLGWEGLPWSVGTWQDFGGLRAKTVRCLHLDCTDRCLYNESSSTFHIGAGYAAQPRIGGSDTRWVVNEQDPQG